MHKINLSDKPKFENVLERMNRSGDRGLYRSKGCAEYLKGLDDSLEDSSKAFSEKYGVVPVAKVKESMKAVDFRAVYASELSKAPGLPDSALCRLGSKVALRELCREMGTNTYDDLLPIARLCSERNISNTINDMFSGERFRWFMDVDPYVLAGFSTFYLDSVPSFKRRVQLDQLSAATVGAMFDSGNENLYVITIPQAENLLILSQLSRDKESYSKLFELLSDMNYDFYTALACMVFNTTTPTPTERSAVKAEWFYNLGVRGAVPPQKVSLPSFLIDDLNSYVSGLAESGVVECKGGFEYKACTLFGREFRRVCKGGFSIRRMLLSGMSGSALDLWSYLYECKEFEDVTPLFVCHTNLFVSCKEGAAQRVSESGLLLGGSGYDIIFKPHIARCEM